jgi:hypothetical protein
VTEHAGTGFPILVRDEIEMPYFHLRFVAQSMLVGLHANRRAESHVPVAMDDEAELFAAMIAAECHDWFFAGLRRETE